MRTHATIHRQLLRLLAFAVGWLLSLSAWGGHFSLDPDNPRYFLFRGEPTILITSAEHYGALLNLDFDYKTYFEELAAHGLNNTRVFSGVYVEPQGAFNIARNTLAPAPHRFIAPWARSSTPGYSEAQWKLSPQNASNNINKLGQVARTDVYTLDKHGGLLEIHEALVRKIMHELRDFDNLYYEVCNEGTFEFPPTQPGGGGRVFRRQMRTLKEFMHSFDFLRMKPDTSLVRSGLPDGFGTRVLAEAGQAYAIYVSPAVQPKNYAPDPKRAAVSLALELDLPKGTYEVEWLNPTSGKIERREVIRSAGRVVINSPEFQEDVALRIKRDGAGESSAEDTLRGN